MDDLIKWSQPNRLNINSKKTKELILGSVDKDQGHREFPFGNSREFPGIADSKIPGGNSREFLKFGRELRGISRVLSFFQFLLLIKTFQWLKTAF